jgi:hypothetical protein
MAEKLNGIIRASGFPILAVILASCGGGGDGPGKCYSPTGAVCSAVGVDRSFPEPLFSPGLYKGVSSNGQAFASLVLDDRSFYSVHSIANNASVVGGVVQGTVRTDAGKFTITDAADTTLEGGGTQPLAITGTYGTKQFMDGSILYPTLSEPILFSSNYVPDFELTPSMSVIAGGYSGTSGIINGAKPTTLNVSDAGTFTGKDATGCTFSGTIQGGGGRPYAVTVTFGALPCLFPGATATGISYFDRTSNTLYAVGSIPGQSARFVAMVTKQ